MVKVISNTVDITPNRPTYMAGYFTRNDKFKGIHDPIEAVIMWLEVDEVKNLFIVLDLSNLDCEFVDSIRSSIVKKCPVDEDKIVVAATHNHAGPVIVTRNKNQLVDPEYRVFVKQTVVEAAVGLYGQEKKVKRVVYTHGISTGYYGNRNDRNRYGDNHIYMFEFRNEKDENIAAIINLSCHASVLGPEMYEISGDLFAALRRKMAYPLNVVPLIANGCAGDMSNRMYRHSNDYKEVERISMGIASQILNFNEKQDILLSDEVVRQFEFRVKCDINAEPYIKKAKRLQEKITDDLPYEERKVLESQIKACERKVQSPHVDMNFKTTIIRMNNLEIIIIPGEICAALGRQIKEASAAPCCYVWGYANGLAGYVVAANEFNSGMEGLSTLFPKGVAEEYVAKIIQNMVE
ncbi:hypothetical protein C0033_02580 [Clostridium sp. chh4-2]|uniref:hypothetical protein n=1 Tax=Clostridium sp. chh4-2 TaxID=2067550 RepID=UPI000CCEA0E8|nr:hypothetical protein [Clostridium sp. chh4-2]PNV63566.1 hypothetical protein C0033_02580 [Clostridium sp. chh4-2]